MVTCRTSRAPGPMATSCEVDRLTWSGGVNSAGCCPFRPMKEAAVPQPFRKCHAPIPAFKPKEPLHTQTDGSNHSPHLRLGIGVEPDAIIPVTVEVAEHCVVTNFCQSQLRICFRRRGHLDQSFELSASAIAILGMKEQSPSIGDGFERNVASTKKNTNYIFLTSRRHLHGQVPLVSKYAKSEVHIHFT
jgi:hypothetical protein